MDGRLANMLIQTGFLPRLSAPCVQGLLSIHGKELGMVEDTVAAMEMLADFKLQVCGTRGR